MTDKISELVDRLVTIVERGIPGPFFATALVLLAFLIAVAVIAYFVRGIRRWENGTDPYDPYKGPTVNVTVGNNTVRVGAVDISAEHPSKLSDRVILRHYTELRRIAALAGDDDEELRIS